MGALPYREVVSIAASVPGFPRVADCLPLCSDCLTISRALMIERNDGTGLRHQCDLLSKSVA